MKNIFLKTSVFTIALAFLSVAHVSTVDAKRLGGGGNAGRSSNAPMQKQAQPAAQQNQRKLNSPLHLKLQPLQSPNDQVSEACLVV